MKIITTEQIISSFREYWGDKYDYSVTKYTRGKPVEIICKDHGIFSVEKPSAHMRAKNGGCRQCWIEKNVADNRRQKALSQHEFLQRCFDMHGGRYDYSKTVYTSQNANIIVICDSHGEFITTPYLHLKSASGCKECSKENISALLRETTEWFISRGKQHFGSRFDYSCTTYTGSHKYVSINCREHGPFTQLAYQHVTGHIGCSECHAINKSAWQTKSRDAFLHDANAVHGDVYDYSQVDYQNSKRKINIVCHTHGIFRITPNSHLNGQGCSKCTGRVSRKSQAWLDSLGVLTREFRLPGTRLLVDGYDGPSNTVYQFHGDFWHGNPSRFDQEQTNPVTNTTFRELYEKTLKTDSRIRSLGYNLVTIWESDWERL